jgi:hypothetical protein
MKTVNDIFKEMTSEEGKKAVNLFELGHIHQKTVRAYRASVDSLNQVRIAERNAWNAKCELYAALTDIEAQLRAIESTYGSNTTEYITGNDEEAAS